MTVPQLPDAEGSDGLHGLRRQPVTGDDGTRGDAGALEQRCSFDGTCHIVHTDPEGHFHHEVERRAVLEARPPRDDVGQRELVGLFAG